MYQGHQVESSYQADAGCWLLKCKILPYSIGRAGNLDKECEMHKSLKGVSPCIQIGCAVLNVAGWITTEPIHLKCAGKLSCTGYRMDKEPACELDVLCCLC